MIAGYGVYASLNPIEDEHTGHAAAPVQKEDVDNQSNHDSHGSHGTAVPSEITRKVSYTNGEITIELKDKDNHEPELEVSHEKYMHLIVVSSDMEEYHHLHPEKNSEGVYQTKVDLADNSYKVFIDIKPKGLNYSVEPIEMNVVSTSHQHGDNHLVVDTEFTKTINNQTVELTTESFKVNKEIMLNFDVKDAKPDPYLGALGHVVILDENGERYIHVHPAADDQTVFKTQFDKPGIYKLWAEFKFGEQVNFYPFVIEVKLSND